MSTQRVMNRSISFYGETVRVQPRTATTTDDTGEVTYFRAGQDSA